MESWTLVPLSGGLGEYSAAWDKLRSQLFRDNPLLDSRFVDTLLRHFGDGSERLCIRGATTSPSALCILRPRSRFVWNTFLPIQAQLGPSLLPQRSWIMQLLQSLPFPAGELQIECNDPDFGDLSEVDNRKGEVRDHALTINIQLQGGFDAYWASRPPKLLQNMRRYERRIETNGQQLRTVCVVAPGEIEIAIRRYAELESRGWKGSIGTAIGIDDVQAHFYRDLMHQFAPSQGAEVHELWFGNTLAASRIAIVSGNSTVMLKTSYDESLSEYAPGRILLRHVIQRKFMEHPGGYIEFYTDANNDLLAWSTGRRWIRHVAFHRSLTAYRAMELARVTRSFLSHPNQAIDVVPVTISGADGVEIYRKLDALPKDVRNLFDTAETAGIEYGLTWLRNLVDTVYAQSSDCRIYVLRRSTQPIAALPVRIEHNVHGNTVHALTNYYSAVFDPALATTAKASDLATLLDCIARDNRPTAMFRFEPMDPASPGYRRLSNALRSTGMLPFQFFCFGNWYLSVRHSWADYLATREGALRNTIKRMGNKFARAGGQLEIATGGPGIDRAIEAYQRVYNTSWKMPEPYPEFIPGLIRACADKGWLRLGLAWVDGTPIAAQLWIVAYGKASIYKLAYDDTHKSFAPGTLVSATLMQHVLDIDQVSEVDYLIGDDPYKKAWVDNRRERWGLIAYNPHTLAGLLGLIKDLLSRLARLVKRRPAP